MAAAEVQEGPMTCWSVCLLIPIDTKEVCRLGKWCDSLVEADTLGRQTDEVLVDEMVSSLGSMTWMWLGLYG